MKFHKFSNVELKDIKQNYQNSVQNKTKYFIRGIAKPLNFLKMFVLDIKPIHLVTRNFHSISEACCAPILFSRQLLVLTSGGRSGNGEPTS